MFALGLCGVVFELARPLPIKIVVDYVLARRELPDVLRIITAWLPGAETATGLLAWSVGAAVFIVIGGSLLSLAVLNLSVALCQRLVFDLSIDVYAKLQRLSLDFYARNTVGDLLQRMSGDVFVVFFAVAQVLVPTVISLVTLVGMFLIMAQLDLTLALIALGVVPMLAVALALFTKPMNDTTTRQYKEQGALTAFVEQSLSAMKIIQGYGRESFMQAKLESRAHNFGRAFGIATLVSGGYKEVTTIITGTAAAALLGLGALRASSGGLTIGDLLVFLGYLTALYGPVNALSTAVGAAIAIGARGRRVFEILDANEEIANRPRAVKLAGARGEVRFENVTFGYQNPDDNSLSKSPRPVLQDISFRALPGQITAIVGATGAGKTSLISLLARFYDVWQGRILIDGCDVRDLELESLRDNIALVLQEPYLFPMTIADNIAFGKPAASRAEIVDAARLARAHNFVESLPHGYDTVIGEKGSTLSGGERQRIAIARAILKDAPILILDEPTSALDAHTEAQIFEALSSLMHKRTTFIISHRLSTIRRANQILAIEDGRIVERGTHETLLAAGNVYAQLYKHQHIAVL